MFPEIGKTWLQERAAGSLKPEQLLPQGTSQQESAQHYAADEFKVTLHGETYHIKLSGSGRSDAAQRPYFVRSEEHTSELQSLMRNSYAVFCLKQKTHQN